MDYLSKYQLDSALGQKEYLTARVPSYYGQFISIKKDRLKVLSSLVSIYLSFLNVNVIVALFFLEVNI